VFLPAMQIGGMQFFRSESFDLGPGMMPRATAIAADLFRLYLGLSLANMLAYALAGMSGFDAITHTMTTISTGGFSNYDSGFEHFSPSAHYAGALFMTLAAMPFVRMVQMMRGNYRAVYRDSQARAYVSVILVASAIMLVWVVIQDHHPLLRGIQEVLFNVVSVLTGTGYTSDPYDQWGTLAVAIFFVIPLIGGCTGSTSCSAKIFRYQILFGALVVQIRHIRSPNGVFPLRYQGRTVEPEVVSSIMAFFFVFVCCLSVWSILLSLMGLDTLTAISASVAALGNLGPGLGPVVGTQGNFASLPDTAKWLLSLGMVLGRLEFLSVLVLFIPIFWQR
jgi:trk system potassium uptake protein TrkH